MNTKHNLKTSWIMFVLLGCSLALVALIGQVVSAQPVTPELKPPFRFAESPAAPAVQALPPGSTVLMTENFGVTFNPTTNLQGSTPLWRKLTNPDDTAGYYWNRVGSGAFINTAWSATEPIASAPALSPGVSTYPPGQDAWLIYGPIDLSRYVYGHLSFEYYLDSQSSDTLLWGYSTDGQVFYTNGQGSRLGTWITDALTFRSNSTYQTVYLAFAFNSLSNPQGKGAFVRNVRLTGEPVKYNYIPVVMNNYTPPTPTPIPPLYGYTFDPGNTTDLAHWGGAFTNPGTTKYGQCIPGQCDIHYTTAHGNPPNSLRMFTGGTYRFIATSPNDIAPGNYDLYVDMSPWIIYPRDASCVLYGCPSNDLGDWYGIIFNASSDTFGANPSQFAYNKTYYRVYFYNVDSVKPIALRLDRCDGSSNSADNSCHKLGSSSLPGNFIGNASAFDTIHIQRLASGSIQVWLNGTLLITANDATYTGSSHGKYGTFIFSWTLNGTTADGSEMQVDFDNIKLYSH